MLASTAPLVDLLLEADVAASGNLHLLLVAGAGTTIATCSRLPGGDVCSWSGLIAAALRDAAHSAQTGTPEARARMVEDADRCKSITDAEDLLRLCDRTCEIYLRSELDLSQWIFKKLHVLGKALEAGIKDGTMNAPLLDAIRDWQASLGAVVATTNYDCLLSIAGCGKPIELFEEPIFQRSSPSLADVLAGAQNVIHLHGRYDLDGSAVFSADQYDRLMAQNIAPCSFARTLFNATLPIFIGCGAGLADRDLSMLISERVAGPSEFLKQSVVLHLEGDDQIRKMMAEPPCSEHCIPVVFGNDHCDLVPFLEKARQELLTGGFRGRRSGKGTLRAEAWLRQRREQQVAHGTQVPVPPLQLDHDIYEMPLRRFHGTLLKPRVPSYEFQVIDSAITAPGADAALHEDAHFDPVPLSTLDALPLVVLLGDGGSGKTALTHLLISRALVAASERVAIHVRVADYFRSHERYLDGNTGAVDLWQFLLEELSRMPSSSAAPPPTVDLERALIAACGQANVLVVLDGLDEVSRLSDRAVIVAEATRLHERLASATTGAMITRHNRLVLTSRFSGYRSAPVLHPSAQHLVLCPLMPAQVGRLHDSFFAGLLALRAADPSSLLAKRRALRREIAAGPLGATTWIDTPLMAILVSVVFLTDGKLPVTREALFDRVVGQGCAFVVDRVQVMGRLLTVGELRRGLEEAAYRIFQIGVQDALSRTSLREAFQLLHPSDDAAAIEVIVDAATSDHSLLRERGPDRYAFVHRGVLEYLCGCRLQHDVEDIAGRAREAAWKEPASFAAGLAVRSSKHGQLTDAVAAASSIANGYRPLLCLLRGALYASCLDRNSRRAVARATIVGAADLASHVASVEEHRTLCGLLRTASRNSELLCDFEACLVEAMSGCPDSLSSRRGALLVCEGLATASPRLVAVIDATRGEGSDDQDMLPERIQRALIKRQLEAEGTTMIQPLIPFGAALAHAAPPLIDKWATAWRRALPALSGGIADTGHADLRQVRMILAKLLAAPNARRNILMFTLAEHLRDLALSQQEAVARSRLARPGRARSQQEVLRELRRQPDLELGIAYYLDLVAEPALNDATRLAVFEPRHLYRTPRLADEILASLVQALPIEALVRLPGIRAKAPDECAVLDAIAGCKTSAKTSANVRAALALAAERVADGAVRSLLAVEASLSSLSDIQLTDLGFILADAVVDLKFALEMPAQFEIGKSTHRADYIQRNARETLARTITGEQLNEGSDVYNAMVILDVLDATKRVNSLIDLGHSRVVASGRSTWDWPPLPLPHLHDLSATILGDVIDILEMCPPSISALRSDTLRDLRAIALSSGDEWMLELDAALALDWGAQAPLDEAPRFDATTWEDRGLAALEAARGAKSSLGKARALTRLLRLSSADELESREREIDALIEQFADPLDQILAYELLADRAHPARGQTYAGKAFSRLWSAHPFPTPLVRRLIPPNLVNPELCARAYARLSVWLPPRQRDQALVAAVGLAGEVAEPWARTLLLQALRPYARHSRRAQRLWIQYVGKLPSYHHDYCVGDSGAVLCHLVDQVFDGAPMLAHGEADPIVAYSLLRDARRKLGDALAPWEVVECAEITPEGAEKVRLAFQSAAVPRMSAASLLSLRAFSEAGMPHVAAFVLARVPRHPPGAAAVVAETAPDIAQLVRAVNRGMDASSAPAVAAALFGDDEAARVLAVTILEPSVPAHFEKEEARKLAPFTRRRASVEGLDTMLEFARAVTIPGRQGGPMTHADRYIRQVLLETPAQADRLIEAARCGADMQAARWLLERGGVATPQFLQRLVAVSDPDEEIAPTVLMAVAQALSGAPILCEHLATNGTDAMIWEWVQGRKKLARYVHEESPNLAARFLIGASRLDPADMDPAYAEHCTIPLLSLDEVIPALAAWGRIFFVSDRPESDQTLQDVSALVVEDQRTLAALVSYCAWDARNGTRAGKVGGIGLRSLAWPLLAICAERCPVTLQALMHGAAMFDDLPALATGAWSWVTRRSAFRLMSLEWHCRPARVSFDVIDAALATSNDVWQVQEAALAMVATIRSLDNSALDLLYVAADRSGMSALMAFRMINAILNNERTPLTLRRRAQVLVEQALASSLGDRLIEHGIATANAPPRMRLREVLLRQIFADA